jgi:hypothetical protein
MAFVRNQMQPHRPPTQEASHLVDLALKPQQVIVASNAIGAARLAFKTDSKRLLHMVCLPGHRGLIAAELAGSEFTRT